MVVFGCPAPGATCEAQRGTHPAPGRGTIAPPPGEPNQNAIAFQSGETGPWASSHSRQMSNKPENSKGKLRELKGCSLVV